jgi:hypothetical protein
MSTVDYSDFHSKHYSILRQYKTFNDMLDIIQENYHDKHKSYNGPTQDEKDRIKAIWSRIDERANPKLLKALLYFHSDSTTHWGGGYGRLYRGEEIYEILFGKVDIPSKASLKSALDVIMNGEDSESEYEESDDESVGSE